MSRTAPIAGAKWFSVFGGPRVETQRCPRGTLAFEHPTTVTGGGDSAGRWWATYRCFGCGYVWDDGGRFALSNEHDRAGGDAE